MKLAVLLLTLFLTTQASAKPIKVVVIDTGLDFADSRLNSHLCMEGHKDFTGEGFTDTIGHGTAMVGLIEQYAKESDYCLIIYKYYTETAPGIVNLSREIEALNDAAQKDVDIVNLSGGGPDFYEKEYLAIRDNPGTLFIVAAGNDGKNLDIPGNEYYPASYYLSNELIIGSINSDNQRSSFSNYGAKVSTSEVGEGVKVVSTRGYAMMSGTSPSTAIFTGKLIRKVLDAKQSVRK